MLVLCVILFFYCFGREKEKEISTCCPTYLWIYWLILARALTGIEPATLVYWDDALTN